jgi:hypothetical protein
MFLFGQGMNFALFRGRGSHKLRLGLIGDTLRNVLEYLDNSSVIYASSRIERPGKRSIQSEKRETTKSPTSEELRRAPSHLYFFWEQAHHMGKKGDADEHMRYHQVLIQGQ